MASRAIFDLYAKASSNFPQYANDLVRGLQTVERAARTPQGFQSQLAPFAAREQVSIRGAAQRGLISPAREAEMLRAVDQAVARMANEAAARFSQQLGRPVRINPPSPAQLERSIMSLYRGQGLADPAAAAQTASLLRAQQAEAQRAADAARRLREAQQRAQQMGIDPRVALPPGLQALLGGPTPQALRALMGRQDYPRVTGALGQQAGLLRGVGLDIGVQQRLSEIRNIGGPFDNTQTAGVRNALAGFIRTVEQGRTQQQIYNQLTGRAGPDLARAQRDLAAALERNRALSTQNALRGTADPRLRDLSAQTAQAALARLQADRNRLLGLQLGSPAGIGAAAQGQAAAARLSALVGAQAARLTGSDQGAVDAQARLAQARARLAAIVGAQAATATAGDRAAVDAQARLAAARQRLATIVGTQVAGATVGDQAAVTAQARLAAARQRLAAVVGTEVSRNVLNDQTLLEAKARERAAHQRAAAAINAATARSQASDQAFINLRAQEMAARQLRNRAINDEARRQLLASLPPELRGTRTQQLQSYLSARQGAPPRLPTDFQTLPQILTSRLVTTAGFAASGALLYGGVNLIRDTITDSTALQQELVLVKSQFEDLANAGRGDAESLFEVYRKGLGDISRDSGVALNVGAKLTRQLAGAFADEQGQPNFGRAITEGGTALRATQISGLDPQEITDDLTALSRAFDLRFNEIMDITTGFSEDYGVVIDEITNFTSRLAPTAAELGFSLEQLAGLGAIAQQTSGVGGSALAEQFGRILPALSEQRQGLFNILARNDATRPQATGVLEAFQTGDTPEVLRQLVTAYEDLDSSQRNQLTSLVGGRREAQAFYAILARGGATVRALTANEGQYAGEFEKRWRAYTGTLDYSIDRLKVLGEELGNALFRTSEEGGAGIGTGLTVITNSMGLLVSETARLAEGLGTANEFLGGMPGKILAAAAAYRLLTAASSFGLARTGAAGALSGMFAVGGRFNPYTPGFVPGRTVPGQMGPPAPVPINNIRPGAQWWANSRLPGGLRTGGVMAGLGSAAAGVIAPVLIGLVLDQISQYRSDMEGIRAEVDQEAQRLFAEGLTRDEVRSRLLAQAPQNRSLGASATDRARRALSKHFEFSPGNIAGNLLFPVTAVKFGANFFGDDPNASTFRDQIDEVERTDQGEELLKFFDTLSADEENFVSDLAENLLDGTGKRRKELRDALGLESSDADAKAVAAINLVLDKLAADPADEDTIQLASDLFNIAPKDLRTRARELAADAERVEALAADRDASAASTDLLRTLYESRRAGPQALVDALDREISDQREYAEAQRGTDFEADAFRKLAELQRERAQVYNDVFSRAFDLETQLIDLDGGDPAAVLEEKIAAAQATLQNMAGAGVPYEDQFEQAIELERLRREQIVAAMNQAGSSDEVDRLAAQLSETPPEVERAIRAARLTTGSAAVAIGSLQDGRSNEEFEQFAIEMRRQIAETGSIPGAMQKALEERLFLIRGIQAGDPNARTVARRIGLISGDDLMDPAWISQIGIEADAIQEFLNAYGNVTGDDFDEIMAAVEGVDDLAGRVPDVIRQRLEARLDYLRRLVAAIVDDVRSGGAVDAAERRLGGINDEIRRIEEALAADTEAGGGVDPAKLDANRRQISADAAVARAGAAGDPVAIAEANLQEARDLLATYTDRDSPDYREAAARVTELEMALGEAIKDRATKLRDAGFALRRAQANGDSVAIALIDIDAANAAIADAATTADGADDLLAMAQLVNANNALSDSVAAREQSRFQYLMALAAGDPVQQANLQVMAAQAAVAAAGPDDYWAAMAQLAQAQDAQRQAALAVNDAQYQYLIAAAAGDPIRQAELRAQQAAEAVANARGAAERYQALAQQLDADKALRDAILDGLIAQKELASALYDAAGDTVGAARVQLEIARDRLNAAIREGATGAELTRLQAAVVQAQSNYTNVQRQDRLGDLEYLYEFDKITAQQYIALLQAELSKIPESNKEARREIERRIKALRDELGRDLQFNLPGIIMPTFYEARRADQRGGIGNYNAGVATVNNDIVVTVAITEPGASAEAIGQQVAQQVADQITAPATQSITPRLGAF